MSPVSRGRKPKKSKKGRVGRPSKAVALKGSAGGRSLTDLGFAVRRPGWFDPALSAALGSVDALLAARDPRELEEAMATLLGAQHHMALVSGDTRLGAWTEELIEAAAQRIHDDDGSRGMWYLLHGLASVGIAPIAESAGDAIDDLRPLLSDSVASQLPTWLADMSAVTANGEVWQLRDVYGGRFAFIAGFRYPSSEPFWHLFDLDVCGFVTLVHAGVFDDVDGAAAAWRDLVGVAASDATPRRVDAGDDLLPLVHWDHGEMGLYGEESRAVMDNWYRSGRRADDLLRALVEQGFPVPQARSLYRDVDIVPAVKAFITWYAARHGAEPDQEPTEALAWEWLEGTLPTAVHVASPHRAEFMLQLMSDWIDDEITDEARALLPEWVRWNGEQAGTPGPLVEAAVAVAAGGERATTDCPAAL